MHQRIVMFAVAAALALPARAVEVSFYCPFDGSVSAKASAGPGFGVCKQDAYAPGRAGRALHMAADSDRICYVEVGNLDKARGSIELWLRPNWPQGDRVRRSFLWEEGPRRTGANTIWLWKYEQSLRFDVRDPSDRYITHSVTKWPAGEWRHIVATWDCEAGIALYVDGKLVRSRETTWEPRQGTRFFVGGGGRGNQSALADIDDLRIYTHPLTADEVKAAFTGALTHTAAKPAPTPRPVVEEEAPAKQLIFYLPFDGDCAAAVARGQANPQQAIGVSFEPGVAGQAARFAKGAKLQFAEKGNLVKERGTIAMWYRPDWSGHQSHTAAHKEIWRCLVQEGPRPNPRHDSNMLWLWVWGARLRFDVSDRLDQYMTKPIVEWQAGEWHHLAATWDCHKERRLYLDGRRVCGGRDSRKGFLPMQWAAKPFEHFFVGSDGSSRVAQGSIDELKIFDSPLADDEVRAEVGKVFPVVPSATHLYFVAGRPARLRWRLDSIGTTRANGRLSWRLVDPRGRRVLEKQAAQVSIDARGAKTFDTRFTPPVSGEYKLTCQWQAAGAGKPYERTLSFWGIAPEEQREAGGKLNLKRIEEIDCAADLPADQFVSTDPTRVVHSKLGAYREASPKQRSRFALRVRMPHVGRPYVVDWEYPDDKPRTMEMIAQTVASGGSQYELQTGAFCGAEYPLSHRMMTQRSIFWPRGEDMALIFMTAEQGRPVAAAKVRVYEVQGRLPKLPVTPAAPVNGWRRHVGLYYEDPAFCYDFGGYDAMPGFEHTISRLMDYMDYFGQSLFMYPAVWYHGPFYPSASQGLALQRPHPANFIEYMLLRFGQRGIEFIPTLNVHSLPTLVDTKWQDEMLLTGEGAKTPIMMMWDGAPNLTGWHGTAPNYNPLHPDVQQAVLTMVDEMLDLYAEYPAFKGIGFHLTRHCMLWFGELDAGYNDCTVEEFERDTGTHIPVAADDPGRVNKRYRWLMAHARDEWIAWRCKAMYRFYDQIAAKLRERRPDLRLLLTLYRPNKRDIMPNRRFENEADYVSQINRESGVDTALYKGHPNIVVQRTIYPADYRWYRCRRKFEEDPIKIRQLLTESRTYDLLRQAGGGWINMHDRYWEDAVGRGKTKWKEFWGNEMGWRVSTLNPNQDHCLEPYVVPLARLDLMSFTKGGFLVGTIGMERQLGRFTQAFRALPAKRFETLKGVRGPVAMRYLTGADGLYLYLVNPSPRPASVKLAIAGTPRSLTDLVTGKTQPLAAGEREFSAPAYGLESFFVRGDGVRVLAVGR